MSSILEGEGRDDIDDEDNGTYRGDVGGGVEEDTDESKTKTRGRPKGGKDYSAVTRQNETKVARMHRFQDFIMLMTYQECIQLRQKSSRDVLTWCEARYMTLGKCWLGLGGNGVIARDIKDFQDSVNPLFDNVGPTREELFCMNTKGKAINYAAVLQRVKLNSTIEHNYIPKLRILLQGDAPSSG